MRNVIKDIFVHIFIQLHRELTHVFNVQRVNNGFLYLIAGDGSLKSLLFHNLVTFLILHLCILVIRSNPHYLLSEREMTGIKHTG